MPENDNRGQGAEKLPNNKHKGTKEKSKKLNHYTTLPVLLNMLRCPQLFLGDPNRWEDKNDREFMDVYKQQKKLKSLFALCFSSTSETVYHWKAFASGIGGCCIEFDRVELEKQLKLCKGIQYKFVTYKTIKDVTTNGINEEDIPFTKRVPYNCENEYRIIWEGDTVDTVHKIKLDLKAIKKITISGEMPKEIYTMVEAYLKELCLKDNPSLTINQSTLYENHEWIKAVRSKGTANPI